MVQLGRNNVDVMYSTAALLLECFQQDAVPG